MGFKSFGNALPYHNSYGVSDGWRGDYVPSYVKD